MRGDGGLWEREIILFCFLSEFSGEEVRLTTTTHGLGILLLPSSLLYFVVTYIVDRVRMQNAATSAGRNVKRNTLVYRS